jgi:hypothetical protein
MKSEGEANTLNQQLDEIDRELRRIVNSSARPANGE